MPRWQHLRRHGVDFNILCTVNAGQREARARGLSFLRDELEATWMQFIPIVGARHRAVAPDRQQGLERAGGQQAPALYADGQPGHGTLGWQRTIRPLLRGHLRGVGAPRRGPVYVQLFDVTLEAVLRPSPAVHPRAARAARPALDTTAPVFLRSPSSSPSTCWQTSIRRTC